MNRTAFRYSIASVLFVSFVVAGMFAGYRAGFSKGYISGKAKRQSEEPVPRVYDISDLMRSIADPEGSKASGEGLDYTALMGAVETTVRPEEWEAMGGPSSMAPLPGLEALAINAPPDVHRSLESFFADLASVKLAVADISNVRQASQQRMEDATAKVLEPIEKSLATSLEPIAAGVSLVGSWEVRPGSGEGPVARYTFTEKKTLTIDSPDVTQPAERRYGTFPSTLVIGGAVSPVGGMGGMGTAYHAAWTTDQDLVLVPHTSPDAFLVAERVEGER